MDESTVASVVEQIAGPSPGAGGSVDVRGPVRRGGQCARTGSQPARRRFRAGAELVTTVLGWLKWAGLAAALAGLLIGAIATGVGHFGSNYSASSAGRKWLLGGMGAAILSGLSWTIATTLYTATGG